MTGSLVEIGARQIPEPARRRLFVCLVAVVVVAAIVLLATRPNPHASGSRRSPRPASTSPAPATSHRPSHDASLRLTAAGAAPVARTFLSGYLPLVSGHEQHRHLPDATPALKRAPTGRQLVVAPAQHDRRLGVESLTNGRSGSGWRVQALIADGDVSAYPIVLTLIDSAHHWLVGGVSG